MPKATLFISSSTLAVAATPFLQQKPRPEIEEMFPVMALTYCDSGFYRHHDGSLYGVIKGKVVGQVNGTVEGSELRITNDGVRVVLMVDGKIYAKEGEDA